ncbi:MAG TPA: 7TM diverse intracellular signaling domain-containing protein [Flavobacterium sp.]|jgi:signal transduction histidine kinase
MHNIELDLISVFILGATALTFIYHAILYFFSRDRLLIHYLIYLFFTGVFVYIKTEIHAAAFGRDSEDFLIHYFREPIQIIYLTSYFNFIIEAIEVSAKRLFLFRYWTFTMAFLILYSVVHPMARWYFPDLDYNIPFIIMRLFIFGVTAVMLYQSFKLREIKFQLIILYGCTLYFIFGLISFFANLKGNYSEMLIYPLEWLMIGSFIDIIFFSVAVSYRNRKEYENLSVTLLAEAQKTIALQSVVLEKQRELENERARIAADMHDDLGSGLTKITYLSQIAMKQPDSAEHLRKIKDTATALVGNMSELIWVMKEENNTLEDLVTYIKSYAFDYLENNGIDCRVEMPEKFYDITISGNDRRQIFLSVKECLHNIVKHAKATKVIIGINIENGLKIIVSDNGTGICEIEKSDIFSGNGLKNMKSRIESISGNFLISNDNGTKVAFSIPLETTS